MRSTRPLLNLVLGTGLLLSLIVAPATKAQTPKRGGILKVSYGNEIAHLDFHTAPGYEMMWVAMNVGCGLVDIMPDGKFVGDAAEAWQVSSDGLLYTFKLKPNVLFHDGTKVDAAAVKFSIERLMDPATGSGMRTFYESVHSVEALDPSTVQIRLKHPYAFMLHMLAGYRTGLIIYSPTATQKFTLEDRKQGKPGAVVGCGPFKLVEWVKGSHLVMDRFDKYFQPGLPYLDVVVHRHPSQASRDTANRRRVSRRSQLWVRWLRYPLPSALTYTAQVAWTARTDPVARSALGEAPI